MSMIVNRERFLCISKNSNLYIRITANLKALEINGINFFRDEVSSEREFVEFTRLAKHFSCGQLFLIEKKINKWCISGKLVKITISYHDVKNCSLFDKRLLYAYPLNLLL